MPIYDFKCNSCEKVFDQLCRISWQGSVKCPACGSSDIKKLLSQVSAHGRAGSSCGSGGCSGKSCGSCK